jgi:hypothetical protein
MDSTLTPEEAVLHAIARQFIEATDAHPAFEVFYRWLEFPEHADLRTRWFDAAETFPAFRDGDMEQWEMVLFWVFGNELGGMGTAVSGYGAATVTFTRAGDRSPHAQRIEISEAVMRWSRGQEFAVENVLIEQHNHVRFQHYVNRLVREPERMSQLVLTAPNGNRRPF